MKYTPPPQVKKTREENDNTVKTYTGVVLCGGQVYATRTAFAAAGPVEARAQMIRSAEAEAARRGNPFAGLPREVLIIEVPDTGLR